MTMRDATIVILAVTAFAVITYCLRAADSDHANTPLFRGNDGSVPWGKRLQDRRERKRESKRRDREHREWLSQRIREKVEEEREYTHTRAEVVSGLASLLVRGSLVLALLGLLVVVMYVLSGAWSEWGWPLVALGLIVQIVPAYFVFLAAEKYCDKFLTPEEAHRRAEQQQREKREREHRERVLAQPSVRERRREERRKFAADLRKRQKRTDRNRRLVALGEADYVYMVAGSGYIKIGRTTDLNRRVREHKYQGMDVLLRWERVPNRSYSARLEDAWKEVIAKHRVQVTSSQIRNGATETALLSPKIREEAERVWEHYVPRVARNSA